MAGPRFHSILDQMREAWEARALEDALHHSCPRRAAWTPEGFLASGLEDVGGLWQALADKGLRASVPRGAAVLDFGCGAGRMLQALAGSTGQVHGVDISPRMLDRAAGVLPKGIPVQLHVGDGMTTQCVRRHQFQLATLFDVLGHVPEELQGYLVRQIGNRLVPGGVLAIQLTREQESAGWFAESGLERIHAGPVEHGFLVLGRKPGPKDPGQPGAA
jgi:2-polyprenyl-3-methyl-5-hydroxy-6-metoxy-1,4-benzoquinol methylase